MSVNLDTINRPKTTVILAMTADGKIADRTKAAARFGSDADKAHLEQQIALVDGVIFGAGTLKAYGSSLPITNPNLLGQRQDFMKALQPVHILVSASGNFNCQDRFFQQAIPRWLLTTENEGRRQEAGGRSQHLDWVSGATLLRFPQPRNAPPRGNLGTPLGQKSKVKSQKSKVKSQESKVKTSLFEQVIIGKFLEDNNSFDWREILPQLKKLGIDKLAVLGGGELVASLLSLDLIDELWLTVCPIIFGGKDAPTPVEGMGFLQSQGKKLRLLEVKQIDQEIFLHYEISRSKE